MYKGSSAPGINFDVLKQHADSYSTFKMKIKDEGRPAPLGEGILIWDETKVSIHVPYTVETPLIGTLSNRQWYW